jgi:exodeoxyribonuclease VII large subunit
LQQIAQRLDELEWRLGHARRHQLRHHQTRLAGLQSRLQRHTPQHRLARLQARHQSLHARLQRAMQERLTGGRGRLALQARTLEAVSPLATLHRGYAIVTREADGAVLEQSTQVEPGARVRARLASGELLCRVEERMDE